MKTRFYISLLVLISVGVFYFYMFGTGKTKSELALEIKDEETNSAKSLNDGFILRTKIIPPTLGNDSVIIIKVDALYFVHKTNGGGQPDFVCIERIIFQDITDPTKEWYEQAFSRNAMNTCFETMYEDTIPAEANDLFGQWSLFRLQPVSRENYPENPEIPFDYFKYGQIAPLPSLEIPDTQGHFWYPFDDQAHKISVDIYYEVFSYNSILEIYESTQWHHEVGKPGVISPIHELNSNLEINAETYNNGKRSYDNYDEFVTVIDLKRPLYLKIVFPVLALVITGFVLLISFINDLGIFVEGGLAVFLSLFSFQQLIIPPDTNQFIVWNFLIWALIFTFGVSLISHLIMAYREEKSSKKTHSQFHVNKIEILTIKEASEATKIPVEALRNACRSGDLKASKSGGIWRFNQEEFSLWLKNHG